MREARKLKTNRLNYYPTKEEAEAAISSRWKFYLPDRGITDEILRLSEAMGDDYRSRKYETLYQKERDSLFDDIPDISDDERRALEDRLKDKTWLGSMVDMLSDVIFHNKKKNERTQDEEYVYFQKFVAEKMYNHLAMLARTRHAQEGGEFSLKEEFTAEIAPKLGLGLYLQDSTPETLSRKADEVLNRLAAEFESWFVERGGILDATFGQVCSYDHAVKNGFEPGQYPHLLILDTDVNAAGKDENFTVILSEGNSKKIAEITVEHLRRLRLREAKAEVDEKEADELMQETAG